MDSYHEYIDSIIINDMSALSRQDIIITLIEREITIDEYSELVKWICNKYPHMFNDDVEMDLELGTSLPAYPKIKRSNPLRRYIKDVIKYASTDCGGMDKKILEKNNSPEVSDKLVESLLYVAVAEAKEYMDFPYVTLIDLIETGNIGLINAIYEYKEPLRSGLIEYVKWWIDYYIQININNYREIMWYRLNEPEKIRNYRKVVSIQRTLRKQLRMEPTREQLEKELIRLGAMDKCSYYFEHEL